MSKRGERFNALRDGKKFYSTDKPCRNGHIALRLTINGRCLKCQRETETIHRRKPNVRSTIRERVAIRRYGITPNTLTELLTNQDRKCATCRIPFGNERMNCPNIDHNHKSGEVRGLLCSSCNFAIGAAKDDPKILMTMIEYLNKYNQTKA